MAERKYRKKRKIKSTYSPGTKISVIEDDEVNNGTILYHCESDKVDNLYFVKWASGPQTLYAVKEEHIVKEKIVWELKDDFLYVGFPIK